MIAKQRTPLISHRLHICVVQKMVTPKKPTSSSRLASDRDMFVFLEDDTKTFKRIGFDKTSLI
jgi:hypothetical protein